MPASLRVRENDRLDWLFPNLVKLRRDSLSLAEHHLGVDEDDAVITNDHRDVRDAEPNNDVNIFSNLEDLCSELCVLSLSFCIALFASWAWIELATTTKRQSVAKGFS